ncbi:MAG TPA: fibronectin type III domain-containing protein, partial [Candidatus Hydrogenedentes bacterium]|nr:fibronectin type III domain-containing protein [Candidatus Hydrogenedentota bacterium]
METAPFTTVKYTLAAMPVAPMLDTPSSHAAAIHALDLVIGPGDGNPAATQYAVQVNPPVGANSWVQADGTLGASPVFRMAAAWDGKRVTGLAKATAYTFTVTARNGEGVETLPGPGATLSTADNLPPSAPVLSFPTVQSDGGNLVCAVVFPSVDPEGDTVYYAYDWHVKRFGAPDFVLFRDGAPAASLSDQINNVDTLPNDLWYCAVTAYDGEDHGMPEFTPQCEVVLGGVIPSFVFLGTSPGSITLGQPMTAFGQIAPIPAASGTVAFSSVSPSGVSSPTFPEGTVFAGGAYTKTFYPSEASEGRGPWTLSSSWPGDDTYQSASSTPVAFTVLKAQPSLSLTLSASSAPLGYADLSANAALSAGFPAELRPLLSGLPVRLWVKKPDASSAGPVLGTT